MPFHGIENKEIISTTSSIFYDYLSASIPQRSKFSVFHVGIPSTHFGSFNAISLLKSDDDQKQRFKFRYSEFH